MSNNSSTSSPSFASTLANPLTADYDADLAVTAAAAAAAAGGSGSSAKSAAAAAASSSSSSSTSSRFKRSGDGGDDDVIMLDASGGVNGGGSSSSSAASSSAAARPSRTLHGGDLIDAPEDDAGVSLAAAGRDLGADETELASGTLRLALICQMNYNRSMNAHARLAEAGYPLLWSYGVADRVKLPGPRRNMPNVYSFGRITYNEVYEDLMKKDPGLYQRNGLLKMADRNRKVKQRPQRFQEDGLGQPFDLIISYDRRAYDRIVKLCNGPDSSRLSGTTHVLDVDTRDTPSGADVGAKLTVEFVRALVAAGDEWEDRFEEIVDQYLGDQPIQHTVIFY